MFCSVPGRVKDIVITPHRSNTQLDVRWLPPEMPNGILTGYELNVSTSTNTVYYDADIKPNDNMRTVTSLSRFQPSMHGHTVYESLCKSCLMYSDSHYNRSIYTLLCVCCCIYK